MSFLCGKLLKYSKLLLFMVALLGCAPVWGQSSTTCELFPLDAPVPRTRSFFSSRSSISERFAIAGADADATGAVSGKAHIYEYVGGVWVFRQTLSAPGTLPADSYGNQVHIDENTAVVAASGYHRTGTSYGAIYVYTRQGSQWVQTGLIMNPSLSISAFGWSLAKSGTEVVVGCGYNGTQNFAAYVFRQPAVPTQPWALVATLTPQAGSNTGYDYGYSLAIEGDNLVVGSLDAFGFGRSAAYFYHRTSAGAWVLAQIEAYPNGARAGFSAALHGRYATIGADANMGTRLYELTSAGWQLRQTLYDPDNTVSRYGFALAQNAGVLLVGCSLGPNAPSTAGVVYRYELRNGTWVYRRRYIAPQPVSLDGLGAWVALDHTTNNFVLSAPSRLSLGVSNAGQAFVHWNPAVLPAGPFCPDGAPVLLQATAGGGVWSGPGITNGQTGAFNPAQAGPGTHLIGYALTANGCTYRDTVAITIGTRPRIVRPSLPALRCTRDTVFTLAATLPGGTWAGPGLLNAQAGTFSTWAAGPGRHTVTYTLAASPALCATQDTFSYVVRPAGVRATPVPRRLSCARDTSLLLQATPAGGTWRGPGITNSATGLFSTATAGPGRHVLTYSLAAGLCSGQDTLSLVVQPVAVRVASPLLTLCRLDTVVRLLATPAGGSWRGKGISNAQQGLFSTAVAGAGRFVVRYELGSGRCRAVDSVAITVNPVTPPLITSPLVLRCGEQQGLLSVAPAPATSYQWQYATSPAGPWQPVAPTGLPTYQATQAGFYRVRALAGGCTALSAAVAVAVEPVQAVFIPNIFTPNQDGLNDVFELKLQYPRSSHLQVFNRWGREVFRTDAYGDFWTGKEAGAGVYYYIWRYSTDCDPTEHTAKGWVSIVL